jgi:hypothetical protein
VTERSRDERIEDYYHQSAWDLAERIVDLEDELGEEKDGICTGVHADVAEARAEIERLRTLLTHESERADINCDVATGWGQLAERRRLAWLSARRRAADEANFGMEALELLRAELAQAEAEHKAFVAQLTPIMGKRMNELRRAHAFVAEVQAVRGACMDGDAYRSHLRPIYDALHELEAAEREGRPYRDRWTRTGHEALADQCPTCDTIPTSVPQPAPCTCDDEAATVAYWRAELERAHQDEVRQSTSGAPHLECVGPDGEGGTVWRLAGGEL